MDDISGYYHPPPPPPPPPDLHSYYLPPLPSQTLPPPPHIAVLPHDPYQFHHHPNPSLDPYPYPLASSPVSSHDELRTLFVAGLPDDVKPREIYNLFREFPGYLSSNLRPAGTSRDSQPFAFAEFSDQQSAVAAMHAINGMVFDLEKGSTLYIDLAKSNSRSKRSRIDDDLPDSHKKFKGSSSIPRASIDPGNGSIHIPGVNYSAHNTIGYTTALRSINATGVAKLNYNMVTQASQNNLPCPTLFVANLGPHCKERELIQVFSRCCGFIKLKVQNNYGTPVAFVDFKDTSCSTEALNQLQGVILNPSAGEGMRLEYPFFETKQNLVGCLPSVFLVGASFA